MDPNSPRFMCTFCGATGHNQDTCPAAHYHRGANAQSASTLQLLLGAMQNQSTAQLVERVWNEVTPEQKIVLAANLVNRLEELISQEFGEANKGRWHQEGVGRRVVDQLEKELEPMVRRVVQMRVAIIETRLTEYAIEKWDDRIKPLANRLFDEALKQVQDKLVESLTGVRNRGFGSRERDY